MIHFDDFTNDHLYQILIIRGSGSVEINLLFNLIIHQPDIDKIYLYAKVPYEAKYQFLISKLLQDQIILKILNLLLNNPMIWMIFIKTLKNIIQIKSVKYWWFLMIWLLMNLVVKSLIRARKLLFCCAKKTKLYALCIMKIRKKRKLQQIAFSYSSYIQFKDLMILYKKFVAKPFSFLDTDTAHLSDNHLRFRKNILERIWKPIMTIDDKIRD